MKLLIIATILAVFCTVSAEKASLKCYFCQGSCDNENKVVQNCQEALGDGKEARCLDYQYKSGDAVLFARNCIAGDIKCEDLQDLPGSSCKICNEDLCNGGEDDKADKISEQVDVKETATKIEQEDAEAIDTETEAAKEAPEDVKTETKEEEEEVEESELVNEEQSDSTKQELEQNDKIDVEESSEDENEAEDWGIFDFLLDFFSGEKKSEL